MGILAEVLTLFEPTSPHRTTALSAVFFLSSAIAYIVFLQPYQQRVKLPFAGIRNTSFLNLCLGGFRFVIGAGDILNEGYKKVCTDFHFAIEALMSCL